MPRDRVELETYSIDDVIRVPIVLRDEDGVAHVRAVFRRLTGSLLLLDIEMEAFCRN